MSRSLKVYAVVVASAVAISMAGGASALPGTNKVDSGDIINGQVKTVDLANGAVTRPKIADNAVNGAKVANNSLSGNDINEATLNLADTTCSLENVHSFARIKGSASMPSTFTTSSTYIDVAHNCSGGTIEVRRSTTGTYFVRFNGDPALLAMATQAWDGANLLDNLVGITARGQYPGEAGFGVAVRNHDGVLEDGWVNIITY